MSSMGVVEELIGIDVPLRNRPVIVVEDIVDTGHTLNAALNPIAAAPHPNPRSLLIAQTGRLHNTRST